MRKWFTTITQTSDIQKQTLGALNQTLDGVGIKSQWHAITSPTHCPGEYSYALVVRGERQKDTIAKYADNLLRRVVKVENLTVVGMLDLGSPPIHFDKKHGRLWMKSRTAEKKPIITNFSSQKTVIDPAAPVPGNGVLGWTNLRFEIK